jgi:uncharacterized protein
MREWLRGLPFKAEFLIVVLGAFGLGLVAVIRMLATPVFVCGYVVASLRERIGGANAVSVSAGIRLAYHLYQGPAGVLGITPCALIAAIWFVRTRRLAPLIVAHAIVDFTGLFLGRHG